RARGTGAQYAKHKVPCGVSARGVVSPVMRPLLKGSFGTDLAYGYAILLGRLDGLVGWRRTRAKDGATAPTAPVKPQRQ
ncbi:MAG: glycosyltransferase family 2 protein, partial [Noviherbaspirillum sp.]|nr:glycosyltransferase family 2 protein [Noviherbaspirillum sp.]